MLVLSEGVPLSGYTTLRLGGPAARMIAAGTSDEIAIAVAEIDRTGEPLLVLGGGSNLVVADEGFAGTVLRVAAAGRWVSGTGDVVYVTAAAGENWDAMTEWAVEEKLAGIECLAGIPGLVGATPIQNVGAYGQEVAAVVDAVSVYDRESGSIRKLPGSACGFGYRTSAFKVSTWPVGSTSSPTGRYVVLDVTFALQRDPMSGPIRYGELAGRLGIAAGERASIADVREAVLELRRGKGMLLDPADPDTASAGSFFTHPVLTGDQFAELEKIASERGAGPAVPHYPAGDGQVKVPAGWLIEQAGFGKGFRGEGGARISAKHTLALTNAGGASTADLIALARQIAAGVRAAFGIDLVNEPALVGVSL